MDDNNLNKRIIKLDSYTSNKIAAGEVVERPAAVVKELVENAIDSGANQITIEIRKAGKQYIRVTDNGSGIHPEDIVLAFERHATSKIREVKDIFAVESLGFRGEALASIASVSQTELITKTASEDMGIRIEMAGGKLNNKEATGSPQGTTVIVKDLFFNTPARQKFMKTNATETSKITDLVNKLAISHPEIRFKFLIDQKEVFTTPGKGNILNAVLNIYDKHLAKNLIKVEEADGDIKVNGFISNFEFTRGNRQMQMFFVNGRYIKSKVLADALSIAYKSRLPINRFAVCFLMIDLDFSSVDVNIHPAKTEIRFEDEAVIKQKIYQILKKQLLQYNQVPSITFSQNAEPQVKSEVKVGMTQRVEPTPAFNPKIKREVVTPRNTFKPEEVNRVKENMSSYKINSNTSFRPSIDYSRVIPEKKQPAPCVKPDVKQEVTTQEVAAQAVINQENKVKNDSIEPYLDQFFVKDKSDFQKKEQVVMKMQQERKLDENETIYDDLRIIGQLFGTYVLAEKDKSLYLIDQHAAHEKVIYEQLTTEYKEAKVVKQILLDPIIIDLDNVVAPVVKDKL
jgi:DNA mismatch repair protein MutL